MKGICHSQRDDNNTGQRDDNTGDGHDFVTSSVIFSSKHVVEAYHSIPIASMKLQLLLISAITLAAEAFAPTGAPLFFFSLLHLFVQCSY